MGAGYVITTRGFDPYGMPLEGNGGAPFGYTGEVYDASTQLVFLRARYMQPGLGMFFSRDPWNGDAMRPLTYNGWAYVEDNPINSTDILGLCTYCKRGSIVKVGNTGGMGLAARVAPSTQARPLTRLQDGTRVVIAEDNVEKGGGLDWHSTYLSAVGGTGINYGRVWMANDYLIDDPNSPGPTPPPGGSTLLFAANPVAGHGYMGGFGANQFAY